MKVLLLAFLHAAGAWGMDRVPAPPIHEKAPAGASLTAPGVSGAGVPPPSTMGGGLTAEQEATFVSHLESGRSLLARDYLDSAVVELQAAIKLRPDSVEAYDLLARALIQAGNWAATIAAYEKLVRIAPRRAEFHHLLLEITRAYDMPIQETDALERLLEVEPNNVEIMARLGLLFGNALPKPSKRVEALERLVRIKGGDPEAWKGLMEAYEVLRKPKEALAARERWAALEPGNLEIQLALAEAYAASQRPDLEVTLYERLLERAPRDPDLTRGLALAYGHLAEDHAARGLYSRAWKAYQKALALAPGEPVLVHGLAEFNREFHPRLEFGHESGSAGNIRSLRHRVAASTRLKLTETTLDIEGVRRWVREYNRRGTVELARAGATQHLWREWFAGAMAGGGGQGGVYGLKVERRDEFLSLRLKHELDYVYETPQGLLRRIALTANSLEGGVRPVKRLGFSWDFKWGRYSDANWEQSLAWGVDGTLWEQKPSGHRFTLAYSESRLRHSFQAEGSPYFSPIRYLSSSLRPGWEWRNERLAVGASYAHLKDSSSVVGHSYAVSAEGRLNRWLEASAGYEAGRYSGPKGVSGGTKDDLLRLGLGARW